MSHGRQVLCFGEFRLLVAERRLERGGRPVRIGDRSLDILLALLARPGEVIDKRELVERVWPGLHVEDGNLRVNLTTLRTALGDGQGGARFIANVHGRGYAFVAPVTQEGALTQEAGPKAPQRPSPRTAGLPSRLAGMVGREDQVTEVLDALQDDRLVSLVGPGGIGKTTLAVAVGHASLAAGGEADVRFVDLGAVTDDALAAGAVARALDLILPGDPTGALLSVLGERPLLLILDGCERVIGAAAALVEAILHACPAVRILATSREPLRAEGERVCQVASLACPDEAPGLTAAEAMTWPAIQLLVDRAAAAQHLFSLSDAEAATAAEICRRLGGIALAIELAGARIGVIGLRETAAQLGSELALRWPGRRTAVPRHQTLNAALDWSYSELSESERQVLRRLAIFAGPFSVEAVRDVASGDGMDPYAAAGELAGLVAKSLVAIEPAHSETRLRLLDTTRAYARAKLTASGEWAATAARRADHLARRWDRGAGVALVPHIDLAEFKRQIGDVREAADWCFGPGADVARGARLAAAVAPALLELALWADCERWTTAALAAPPGTVEPRVRLELLTSRVQARLLLERQDDSMRSELTEAVALAEALAEPHHHLRALIGLQRFLTRNEDYAASLVVAERIKVAAEAAANPGIAVLADLSAGMSRHFLGQQARACAELRSGLDRMASSDGLKTILFGHQTDFHAGVCLARSLWVSGFPDQATAAARRCVAEAERLRMQGALGVSAIWVIQVHFWTGDLAAAQAMADELLDLTRDHPNAPLRDLGLALRGELLVRQGAPTKGTPLLKRYLDGVRAAGRYSLMPTMTYVEGALALGDGEAAREALDWSTEAAERTSYRLYWPEMLRLKGEIAAQAGDLRAAEAQFRAALSAAGEQEALSWALRAALSLGRCLRTQGHGAEAGQVVSEVLDRLTEGGWTRDQKDARAFLDSLDAPARRAASAGIGRSWGI